MLFAIACVLALSSALRVAAATIAGDHAHQRMAWRWLVAATIAALMQA